MIVVMFLHGLNLDGCIGSLAQSGVFEISWGRLQRELTASESGTLRGALAVRCWANAKSALDYILALRGAIHAQTQNHEFTRGNAVKYLHDLVNPRIDGSEP